MKEEWTSISVSKCPKLVETWKSAASAKKLTFNVNRLTEAEYKLTTHLYFPMKYFEACDWSVGKCLRGVNIFVRLWIQALLF